MGVRAGSHLQVHVCQLCGLRAPRIDHDHGARRIPCDLPQYDPRSLEAVRVPRVLSHEHGDLGVREVWLGPPAKHSALDPELARLLLRQGVRAVDPSVCANGCGPVGSTQVIPLTPTAVVQDLLAAHGVANLCQARGHLSDRGIPVDRLEAAVGLAAQGAGQAVAVVLVVIEPGLLLASVAVRARVPAIAADLHDVSILDLDLQPAVDVAQDAGRVLPFGRLRRRHVLSPCCPRERWYPIERRIRTRRRARPASHRWGPDRHAWAARGWSVGGRGRRRSLAGPEGDRSRTLPELPAAEARDRAPAPEARRARAPRAAQRPKEILQDDQEAAGQATSRGVRPRTLPRLR